LICESDGVVDVPLWPAFLPVAAPGPEDIPEDIPEYLPEDFPVDTPEEIPGGLLEALLEALSEDPGDPPADGAAAFDEAVAAPEPTLLESARTFSDMVSLFERAATGVA
jgi:hypothetical protein